MSIVRKTQVISLWAHSMVEIAAEQTMNERNFDTDSFSEYSSAKKRLEVNKFLCSRRWIKKGASNDVET